ncbi:MAG: glutamyl-tRNA reductase, partial [Desulfobacterales bacterium]
MKGAEDKKNSVLPEIVLIGMNHKTASVELRECIAFSEEEIATTLEALHRHPAIREVLLFSTCNRVEVLLVSDNRYEAVETVKRLISEYKTVAIDSFEEAL